jgi:hypothetical protein
MLLLQLLIDAVLLLLMLCQQCLLLGLQLGMDLFRDDSSRNRSLLLLLNQSCKLLLLVLLLLLTQLLFNLRICEFIWIRSRLW